MLVDLHEQLVPPMPKKKRKSKEGMFLSELGSSFKENGAFWHKISDSPVSMLKGSRFERSKPFDAIAVYRGIPIAIEAKWIEDYKAFGYKSLRESQHEGLSEFVRGGGRSFVFLNIRRSTDKKLGIKRQNRLIIFSYEYLESLGKNLRKKELLECPYVEGSKKAYDLSGFLKRLTSDQWGEL